MLKLFRYLKNYKKESIIGPLFKLIEACFELAVPLVMANIIDVGIKNQDKPYIYKMGGVLVLLAFCGLACSLTAQYFAAKASLGFGTALRRDLFKHINSLSYAEIDSVGSHTLVTRMTADINTAQQGVNILLRLFLRSPFIVLGSIIMAFSISVKLTLIFLIIAPCLAYVIYLIMHITIPQYKNIQKKLDKTNLMTSETLTGARVIRAFSRQKDEEKEFADNTEELRRQQIIAGRISALMNPATYVIVNFAIIAIIWFGGKTVYTGFISQGEVIALVNYMNQILIELVKLANLIVQVSKALACAGRVQAVLDTEPGMEFPAALKGEAPADKAGDAVRFDHVSLTYAGAGAPSLTDISFTAKRGQTIGVIGGTGSGKSSLINLIPRFYDATEGTVEILGRPAQEYPRAALRGSVAVVMQKAQLFGGTIRSNLLWGNKNAADADLWAALETAQAADFVRAKPLGLDEPVEQGGRNLSGGQKQRLTIARALVGKPEILILDDSASALDYATDAALRKALAALPGDLTVFIVSQRAASLQHADQIIVLDDGRMVGLGRHADLLKNCPVYEEIYASQFKKGDAQK